MQDGKVTPFRLTPARATLTIRAIAKDTGKVILGDHALERMEQRDISDTEVYRILQVGDVLDQPVQTKLGEWKCKVVLRLKGNQSAGVVTIILHSGLLFAKTVEWETD